MNVICIYRVFFFFSSRRRHTRCLSDWSSDVCSSDLEFPGDCRLHRAEILQLRGDWEEAEVEAARACDELASWDAAHVAVGLYELGTLSLRRGDVAAAEHAFREVEQMSGSTQPGWATLELLRGRPETACASLKE